MQPATGQRIRATKIADAFRRVLRRINSEPQEIHTIGDPGFAEKTIHVELRTLVADFFQWL